MTSTPPGGQKPAKRHVSHARKTLTEVAERRLKEVGWHLNERTLNASRFAGNCTVIIYYEKGRELEVGIINPTVRNRITNRKGFSDIVVSMKDVEATIDEAKKIVADLRRWITEDHLEAMGIIGMEEERKKTPPWMRARTGT